MKSSLISACLGPCFPHQPNSPRTPYHPVRTHPFADSNLAIAEKTIKSLKESNIQDPKACITPLMSLDETLPPETLEIIAKHLPAKDFYRLASCSKTLQAVVATAPYEPEKRKEAVRPYSQLFELSEANMMHLADGLESVHIHPQLDQNLLATLEPSALSKVQHLTLGWSKDHPSIKQHPEHTLGTFNSTILNEKTGLNNITSLQTRDPNQFKPEDDFSAFSNCKTLKKVVFGSSKISLTNAQLSNLGLAPQLENLSFTSGNALTTANIGALKTFQNLKSLTLNRCATIFPGILQDLKHCPKLSEFTIYDSHENYTKDDIEHLLQHAPQLKTLRCQRYVISGESADQLFEVARRRNMGLLKINGETLQPIEFSIQQLKRDGSLINL